MKFPFNRDTFPTRGTSTAYEAGQIRYWNKGSNLRRDYCTVLSISAGITIQWYDTSPSETLSAADSFLTRLLTLDEFKELTYERAVWWVDHRYGKFGGKRHDPEFSGIDFHYIDACVEEACRDLLELENHASNHDSPGH